MRVGVVVTEQLAAFDVDDHFAIVMKRYDTTLLSLLEQKDSSNQPTRVPAVGDQPPNGFTGTYHQPAPPVR